MLHFFVNYIIRIIADNKNTKKTKRGNAMKKNEHRPQKDIMTPERFELLNEMDAASATELTGLVTRPPQTKAEWDSYNQILSFAPNYRK